MQPNNPNNNQHIVYDPLNRLVNIGTKLEDFEPIAKNEKPYFI